MRDYLREQGVAPSAVGDIVLAIQEAMTNAVRHSGATDDLEVALHVEGSDLVAEIRDHGRGFDVASFDAERQPDPMALGGRGLFLIAELMDTLELRCDAGLEVRAVKRDVLERDVRPGEDDQRWALPGDEPRAPGSRAAMLEEIDEGYFALDWEYRYLFVNRAAGLMTGRGPSEHPHAALADLYPHISDDAGRAMHEAMELGKPSTVEFASLKTGEWRELRVYPTSFGISCFVRDIHERKRRELERGALFDALRESEERFSAMFERSPFALALTRMPEGITIDVNPAFEDLFGFGRDEVVGKTSSAVAIADPKSQRLVAALLAERGALRDFEAVRTTKAGKRLTVSISIDLVTIGGEQHALTTVQDITERTLAEKALHASEEKYRTIVETSAEGIAIGAPGGAFQYVNQRLADMLGYSAEELLGMSGSDVVYPGWEPQVSEARSEMHAGKVLRREIKLRRKDGSALWSLYSGSPLFDGDGNHIANVVMHTDITELKQAEEALARHADLLDLSFEPIIVWRLGGDIESWNSGAVQLYGYGADEALGQICHELLRTTYPQPWTTIEKVLRKTGSWEGELTHRAKDDHEVVVLSRHQLVVGSDGVERVLESNRDIRERKQAEHEREQLVEELSRSNEHSRFLADVVESADMPFGVGAPDGRLILFNQAFADLTGYSRQELEEKALTWAIDLTPTEWRETESALLAKAVAKRRAARYEKEYVRKDGSRVPVEVFAQPVFDETGALLHYRSFLTDITERKQAERALRESEERFRLALRNAPVSVAAQDRDLRFVWAYNQRSARPQQIIGKLDADIFTPEEAERLIAIKRRVLEEDIEVREQMWFERPSGRLFLEVNFEPLHDAAGRVVGVGTATIDLTAMKLAEEALRETARLNETLAKIDTLVHSSLQPDEIIETALREGALALGAETAGLSLHEDAEARFRVAYVYNHPPDKLGVLIPDTDDTHGVEAMRSGQTLAIDDTLTDPRVVRDLMDAWEIKSVICAPLIARGHAIGVVYYNYHSTAHHFTLQEIDFLTRLAVSLSVALENAERYQEQLDIATHLQRSFLNVLPSFARLEIGLVEQPAFRPALIGGDFWDVFELPDGRVAAVIADVAGKGITAAAMTGTVRATIRAFAHIDPTPAFVLRKTNELLLSRSPDGLFVTALVLVLDCENGQMSLASAGHPAPVLLNCSAISLTEPAYGPPLGVVSSEYASLQARMSVDDCLVLYTDGVTETRREGELFGERRMLTALESLRGLPPQEMAEGLRDACLSFGERLRDDLDVLVLKLK